MAQNLLDKNAVVKRKKSHFFVAESTWFRRRPYSKDAAGGGNQGCAMDLCCGFHCGIRRKKDWNKYLTPKYKQEASLALTAIGDLENCEKSERKAGDVSNHVCNNFRLFPSPATLDKKSGWGLAGWVCPPTNLLNFNGAKFGTNLLLFVQIVQDAPNSRAGAMPVLKIGSIFDVIHPRAVY